ncbi:distal tail protein Dit [Caloramator sp. ALD01]|uniref:distal tail protein Dit n=1 Tax=Caloramator sp. ALD01 TaxID=1031288 RepID=UPI0003F7840F|nr:distal tail protein Dit [Caloramator sp. ALD01]
MFSVNFKGIDSSTFGLKVRKRPPICQAETKNIKIEIPGRDGYLIYSDNTRKGFTIPVEFFFSTDNYIQNIRQIKEWLSGEGNLIFSDEPDKYYKATVYSAFNIEIALQKLGQFIVLFDCQPFAYAVNNNLITLTAPGNINNPGNIESQPRITVYGQGNITLNINDNIIQLIDVVNSITVDSELFDCYKGNELKNNCMIGEFPTLKPDDNSISWEGKIYRIEIIPNWRWI